MVVNIGDQLITIRFYSAGVTTTSMAARFEDFYVEEDFDNLDFDDDEPLPAPPSIQEDGDENNIPEDVADEEGK